MPNAIRRLSVALRLVKPYKPYATPDPSTLAKFLTLSKEKYLNDVRATPSKGGEWTVVMGNEAGDLDSLASSIAYAWYETEVRKKPTIPLIQIEREDLQLRAENIYALQLAGLDSPSEQLLLTTDLVNIKPFPSHQFVLVDQNRLAANFTLGNPTATVIAVVDHHEDENLYKDTADPRIIAPAGSCSSHIASLLPSDMPEELATLLLSAILIDTAGLKPGGKALKVDHESAARLVARSTLKGSIPSNTLSQLSGHASPQEDPLLYDVPAIKDLTGQLSAKKIDLSHLGAWDLLRRDYKEYEYILPWHASKPTIKAGLSTVPVRLEAWGSDGKLLKEGQSWMKRRGLSILGVLTSFQDDRALRKSGKGKHRREMVWIIATDSEVRYDSRAEGDEGVDFDMLASKLWTGLEASEEIQVKKHKQFVLAKTGQVPENLRTKVYKQGNANATRKVTAPLLKNTLESSPTPA